MTPDQYGYISKESARWLNNKMTGTALTEDQKEDAIETAILDLHYAPITAGLDSADIADVVHTAVEGYARVIAAKGN